eukprot:scaffold269468_cov17-Tisochrysis_lutea.AAC.1
MISRAVQCPCGLQHPIKEQHTHNTHMPAVDGPHVDFLGDAQFLGLQPRPTAAAGRDGPIHEGEEQDEPLIPVYMVFMAFNQSSCCPFDCRTLA